MRISDWSSDVCSSDLLDRRILRNFDFAAQPGAVFIGQANQQQAVLARIAREDVAETRRDDAADPEVGERPHRMFARRAAAEIRSEEHTSELQSLMRISYAVFCLKKKNQRTKTKT